MKKWFMVLALVLILLTMGGFTGCPYWDASCKDCESEVTGLPRIITLYANDGTVIQKWESDNVYIDTTDGIASFIDYSKGDKRILISGTYIIEEK
jgi:hypothetical protein